ncbi:glycosyltransferase family 39 protein [Sorangium sp. So ce291]|uniref:ArnT family glycosyltransferase n=1 Tax=Sorangium sp. So ce291 TaxID=3133294 RepID=UPI003F6193CF
MRPTARPAPLALADGALALAFAAAYVALLLATAGDLGYARDEGFYFFAASRYGAWFQALLEAPRAALDPGVIDAAWSVNHEHPGLIKSLFALSNLLLQKRLGLFAMEGTSYRFPAMVLSGAGVALVYLWGTQARDRIAGASAAALFAMMPRYFYHAHLACFDAPIVTVWAVCAYAYWRSLRDGGALWPVLTGVTFGLALDTKHNSWFLPIVCVAHAIAVELTERIVAPAAAAEGPPREDTAAAPAPPRGGQPALAAAPAPPRGGQPALAALAAMATIGPLVFYALWPWIWRDTLPRLREYASFHLNHEYYNMEFLGRNYWTPPMPRAYAPVMTAATVPVVTLCLFAAGLCASARARLLYPLARAAARLAPAGGGRALAAARALAARLRPPARDPGGTALLWFLAIAAVYGAWLSPSTPIFGGTKHWMTAYPFVALFAGAAFSAGVRRARLALLALARPRRGAGARADVAAPAGGARGSALARAARGPLVPALLGAAVVAAPVAETLHAHPWALSSYTPLVGGAPGAATLGLNRTFWGYTTGAVVAYLNEHVPPRGTVYIHDTAGQAWDMLLRDGRLRKDIRGVGAVAGADFALYHHEKHMLGQAYQAWVAFGTTSPDHIAGLDGVPVILVYRNTTR